MQAVSSTRADPARLLAFLHAFSGAPVGSGGRAARSSEARKGTSMKFHCPTCEQRVSAEPEMRGMIFECPACQNTLTVPDIAESNPLVSVLRWVSIIPGSFLIAAISIFPIHWVIALNAISSSDQTILWMRPDTFELMADAFVVPFVMVAASAWIAPRRKELTSIFFAISCILFSICANVWLWNWFRHTGIHRFQNVLAVLLNIGSAIFAAHRVGVCQQRGEEGFWKPFGFDS